MYEAGGETALLARFEGLVRSVVARLNRQAGGRYSFEELYQHAVLGLLEAAKRYDGDAASFPTYAWYRVRGAVYDGMYQMSGTTRSNARYVARQRRLMETVESAVSDATDDTVDGRGAESSSSRIDAWARVALVVSTDALLDRAVGEDPGGGLYDPGDHPERATAEQIAMSRQLRARLHEIVSQLPEPESLIVRRRYFEGLQFQDVAVELAVSRSWVSRVHRRAIARLRQRLGEEFGFGAAATEGEDGESDDGDALRDDRPFRRGAG